MKVKLAWAMLALVAGHERATAANLFNDPGFEAPAAPNGSYSNYYYYNTMGPWSINSYFISLTSSSYYNYSTTFNAHSGASYVNLAGFYPYGYNSGVNQTVSTIPGVTYQVSFWVGNTVISGYQSSSTVNAIVNGTTLLSATNSQPSGSGQVWQQFTFSFTATSSSTTIEFQNGSPYNVNTGLDDVQVSPPSGLTTVYSFTGKSDGAMPSGGVSATPSGQLVGNATSGGAYGQGALWSFNPTAQSLTTLYSFPGGQFGAQPGPKLLVDSSGNLFGVTDAAGTGGLGTVFEFLNSNSTLTTLYTFPNSKAGATPLGGLVFDARGNIDGVTQKGGKAGLGSAYQLAPTTFVEKNLFSFTGKAGGGTPASLAVGPTGVVFGSARTGGGSASAGVIYEIDPKTSKEIVLYQFQGKSDGSSPNGAFAFDSSGNLYGTTKLGGTSNAGTLFRFNPVTKQLTTLWNFTGGTDGAGPNGGLTIDSSGNLYGTTAPVPKSASKGTLYEYQPGTGTLTTLHTFTGGSDGATPNTSVYLATSGLLYGTTASGGAYGYGTIYYYPTNSTP